MDWSIAFHSEQPIQFPELAPQLHYPQCTAAVHRQQFKHRRGGGGPGQAPADTDTPKPGGQQRGKPQQNVRAGAKVQWQQPQVGVMGN